MKVGTSKQIVWTVKGRQMRAFLHLLSYPARCWYIKECTPFGHVQRGWCMLACTYACRVFIYLIFSASPFLPCRCERMRINNGKAMWSYKRLLKKVLSDSAISVRSPSFFRSVPRSVPEPKKIFSVELPPKNGKNRV